MTLYRMIDGHVIGATSDENFVEQLRNSSFYPCTDANTYMSEFAKRVYLLYGTRIRYQNASEFLNCLIRLKVVYIQEVN